MKTNDNTYPEWPGFAKLSDTSRDAARIIEPSISKAQKEILNCYLLAFDASWGGLTPDGVAKMVGRNKYFIRPRCSELTVLGYLVATGTRIRIGRFSYHVLKITDKGIAARRGMK